MMTDPLDDRTDNIVAQPGELAGAHLELQILRQGHREYRVPFFESEIVLAQHAQRAFPEGTPWVARLTAGNVTLHNASSGESLSLTPGCIIDLDDKKIGLVDARQMPLGRLEGISHPFTGQTWSLHAQQSWLGRRGKRFNHIELDHSTISRAHASFLPDPHGRVTLIAESEGSAVMVNGDALTPGKTRRLNHGDLLNFGALQFRFLSHGSAQEGRELLNVLSLGTFQIALGAPAETGIQLQSKKPRWLLAALASSWGAAKPVETLIEWLWPELPLERGRRNLATALNRVREEIGEDASQAENLFLRSPSTLGLNPARLGSHDYVEVRKLTQLRSAITSAALVDRLLTLYQGPYLPGCLDDWAQAIRQSLEADVLGTLLASARYFQGQNDFETVAKTCGRYLELDNLSDEAAALLMQAYIGTGRPERALKVFDETARLLKSEGLEPSTELLRQQLQANMAF